MRFISAFVLMLLLLTGATAAAATAPRLALLIGNWDYDRNNALSDTPTPFHLKDLKTPCTGTDAIAMRLKALDFTVSSYCNLTREQFQARFDAFNQALANLPQGAIVFIYYAGHGTQYHGNVFSLPVSFDVDFSKLQTASDEARIKELNADANNIAYILSNLPESSHIRIVLAIDACRDSPYVDSAAYNESVMPEAGPNVLVQYATSAGNTASDDGTYAKILSQELATGKDIGTIITHVENWYYRQFDAGKRDSYPVMFTGPAFTAYKSEPLSAGLSHTPGTPPPPPPPVSTPATPSSTAPPLPPASSQKLVIQKDTPGRLRLDFLWCQGNGGEARFAEAMQIARDAAQHAADFGVGRIRVLPLPVATNHNDNYHVFRNLMRYDVVDPREKALLDKVARAFPDADFLPVRGIGVHGHPTWNYVSAFICEGAP